jgi:predicted DCC family thiol-disulfide oxidoreductase YuxK
MTDTYLQNQPDLKDKILVIFDGECMLCDKTVQYLLKIDKNDMLLFAAFQDKTLREFFESFKINPQSLQSVLVIKDNKVYSKAEAVIVLMKNLRKHRFLMMLYSLFPLIIRNKLYDFVAKNRISWFGKKEYCMMPDEKIRAKFL